MVKDEADIISFSLTHASRFCRRILVLDNGSTDGTWEQGQELGRLNPVIEPFERRPGPFRLGLYGYVFNQVRDLFNPGDWVLLLDADEFLQHDPRPLLESLSDSVARVECMSAQFHITQPDLEEPWFADPKQEVAGFENFHDTTL